MRKFSEGLLDEATILEYLDIRTGQTILDAGCGNGYMAKKFATLVGDSGNVYAIDTEIGFIDKLRKEVAGTNIHALVGNITHTTVLGAASVDLIYLSTVFHIFSNAKADGFVEETKRILKPNGRLAVVNLNKEDTPFGPPMEMRTSPEELARRLPFACTKLVAAGQYFYMQLFENR